MTFPRLMVSAVMMFILVLAAAAWNEINIIEWSCKTACRNLLAEIPFAGLDVVSAQCLNPPVANRWGGRCGRTG
jgi:hypothetical protein